MPGRARRPAAPRHRDPGLGRSSRADDDRADRLFTYALGISIVIHAVLLAIKFQPFDLQKMLDRGPPLEVALVNAKSTAKPTKADILAQANLDGGGNTDADRRAKTPLPVLPKDSPNAELDRRHAEGRDARKGDEGADDAAAEHADRAGDAEADRGERPDGSADRRPS